MDPGAPHLCAMGKWPTAVLPAPPLNRQMSESGRLLQDRPGHAGGRPLRAQWAERSDAQPAVGSGRPGTPAALQVGFRGVLPLGEVAGLAASGPRPSEGSVWGGAGVERSLISQGGGFLPACFTPLHPASPASSPLSSEVLHRGALLPPPTSSSPQETPPTLGTCGNPCRRSACPCPPPQATYRMLSISLPNTCLPARAPSRSLLSSQGVC